MIWAKTVVLLAVMMLHCSGSAGIVVNEVYPGARARGTTTGWIELFNDSDSVLMLNEARIVVGNIIATIPGTIVQARSYVILCETLTGTGSFEMQWGNKSGLWGDTESEMAYFIIELEMALPYNADSVGLYDKFGSQLSLLQWTHADDSLRSWERTDTDGDSAQQCQFAIGGTPGELNSSELTDTDIVIDSCLIAGRQHQAHVSLVLHNAGIHDSPAMALVLVSFHDSIADTLQETALPPLAHNESFHVELSTTVSGMYQSGAVFLPIDNRPANSQRYIMLPGIEYPPLILSEIMAAPSQHSGGEWIEVSQTSDTVINVQGWVIADAAESSVISDTALFCADSIVILAQSKHEFESRYGVIDALVIEPSSWSALNNDGDIIRLVDPYGVEADVCRYASVRSHDFSIARDNLQNPGNNWYPSQDSGGTPGAPNRVVEESVERLTLEASPRTISPDGDGKDDETIIHVVAPPSARATLRVFNSVGQVVKELLSGQFVTTNDITWNGRDRNGNRLHIGIYIVLLEITDGLTARIPVVIAR